MQVLSARTLDIDHKFIFSRLISLLIVILLLVAILAHVVAPILAYRWTQNPFLGVLVQKTLQINKLMPISTSEGDIDHFSASPEVTIFALDGQTIQNIDHLNQVLSRYKAGDEVNLAIRSKSGDVQNILVDLQNFTFSNVLAYSILPYLVGLSSLIIAIWVFTFSRRDTATKIFTLFAISISLSTSLLFDANTTNQLTPLWIFGVSLAGPSFLALAIYFPEGDPFSPKKPALSWIVFIPGILLYSYALYAHSNSINPFWFSTAMGIAQVFILVGFLFYLFWMRYRWVSMNSPTIKEQYRIFLIGIFISFIPSIGWIALNLITNELAFHPYLLMPIPFFSIAATSVLSKKRLLQADYIARQTLLYIVLIFLTSVTFSLFVTGITIFFGGTFEILNPLVTGILIFILAVIFFPIKEKLQRTINQTFNRNQELYRQQIETLSHELTRTMDVSDINRLLRQVINESLAPSCIHIFLTRPGNSQYHALDDENGQATSDLTFPVESGLVKVLSDRQASIFLGDTQSIPAILIPELARIGLLGAILYVPLSGRHKLIGWIALGPRRSHQPYRHQDLGFLDILSDQSALAFQRAQAAEDLERRIHQMTVLNRITQGINLTASYDDVLELICAQSAQIIPTQDFKISLLDERTLNLTSVFVLENNERYTEYENRPIPQSAGLEAEVIKLGKPVITQDYERECRKHGNTPIAEGVFAWIGVPLNTRDETIGVLSLGNRDPSVVYTDEQAKLLHTIADQAASAIVKARLLEQAERRARQLTMLNEITQKMSSTLEWVPLLNQILSSAVDIVNSGSGFLLLRDEETDDFICQACFGDRVNQLLGINLPQDTDFLREVVISRQAKIVNESHDLHHWIHYMEVDPGSPTIEIIVAPMLYRDELSGVIAVVNRKDDMSFTKDDLDLLSAFTNQAAVAIENARLFTRTDQRLAERVEELSVLQRIDRELNTSLDIENAMRVTLGWALRQSRAEVGLIGMIEGSTMQVMATSGYTPDELAIYQKQGIPLTFPVIKEAINSGFPQIMEVQSDNFRIRKGTLQQLVIPLRRELQTIGLVFMESQSPSATEDEIIGFLNRLGDHAAIAIENSLLYAAVQEANQAKSDFVSFVSHELKTPMTSIRGFSDLIASGIVGPINENQANFLTTIRSNVDRMATLVSDITDISRIEAGKLRLEFSAIPISEIVDEVVRSTRTQIMEKKQTLILKVPEELPNLWGDRIRLIQILTNLVSNANKYTQPEGSILINAEATRNIWTDGVPEVIHITVNDNGYGISDENQGRIFQKFYRSDDQKIRDAPGSGLGLNITKQLVELQGGHIWFESVFREGTTFHFTIPIAERI
jgi:signal transduction histidine kinase/signal transduction protein with GAF and PtsI domain